LDVSLEQIKTQGAYHIAKAEAQKRAAQILAEMLSVVCHREYFELGDQMVCYYGMLLTVRRS